MPGTTAWVLADQLTTSNPALDGADRVLIVQSAGALQAKRFHRQKLHLVLVAMRHFARELEQQGLPVDYVTAETLATGLRRHVRRERPDRVLLMAPKSAAGRASLSKLPRVQLLPDVMFLTDPGDFSRWAAPRRRLVMEDFYRDQRRRLGLLMDGDQPVGGRWNFDAENRRTPPATMRPPRPYRPREGEHDDAVRDQLDAAGIETWGEDGPRRWPANRTQARRALRRFIDVALPEFGPFQDAMRGGERTMWHSLLSSSLNLGLLSPLECAEAAQDAYRAGRAPLESAEGFMRQIIGWREFIWCMYWHLQPDWTQMNALDAHATLPDVLETGATRMRCLSEAVGGLRRTGYAHHIERLMLFGNLVLLTGTEPAAALDWFHRAFIDGYDWVMAPNVLGMATWADGGRMMTKPYAASGRYVDRMSDHCTHCVYEPGTRSGKDACPFTTLYWDFLARNRERLKGNHRMGMMLRNLDRIDPEEQAEIAARASRLIHDFDA
jgi:deoxyribodipyrimidine photolyase-related protein